MVLFRRLTLLSLVVALLLSNTRFDSVSAQTVPIIDLHFHADQAWDIHALVKLFDELGVAAAGNGARGSDGLGPNFAEQYPGRFVPYGITANREQHYATSSSRASESLSTTAPEVGTVSGKVGGIVDETLVWNQVMLDAIVASTLGNPQTMRMAATVNTAMFDARNGVSQKYTPIFVTQTAPPGTHRRAAVVQAAYVTLKTFYPAQLARFDNQRALSLAEFDSDDPATVQRGIDWGENVAKQVLAWRATDGFSNPVPPFKGAGAVIGQWESATGASMSPGNISFTAPFVLTSNTQFQSAFPRPWTTLDRAAYAASFNELATMGVKTGSRRTLDQTRIAFFFNGYATNDYVEAAIQIAKARQTSRRKNSRIFALLTIAMHDTSVTVFRAKHDFAMNPADVTWRPILAMPKADLDGNPNTAPISGWVPLITTPNHPEYPGSHPGSHGSGPRVLQHFFGDVNAFELHPAFNTVFPGPPEGGVQPRHYTRISDMAQEGIDARTYGGMHFRGASNATAVVGAQIADYILANAARPLDDDDSDSD